MAAGHTRYVRYIALALFVRHLIRFPWALMLMMAYVATC
jgi:hypothetical protein